MKTEVSGLSEYLHICVFLRNNLLDLLVDDIKPKLYYKLRGIIYVNTWLMLRPDL